MLEEKLFKISVAAQCPIEEAARRVQAIASTQLTWTPSMVADDLYSYASDRGKLPTLEEFEEWLQEQTAKWIAGQMKQAEMRRGDRPKEEV